MKRLIEWFRFQISWYRWLINVPHREATNDPTLDYVTLGEHRRQLLMDWADREPMRRFSLSKAVWEAGDKALVEAVKRAMKKHYKPESYYVEDDQFIGAKKK